jgi:threonine aldolase
MGVGKSFGSDNHSGVHPEVWAALAAADVGHAPAYGADSQTERALAALKNTFGSDLDAFFVFTGTAANTLSIQASCQSYEAVLASEVAHLEEDECGAPEAIAGVKIMTTAHHQGKIRLESLQALASYTLAPHRVKPRLLSLTQATELGTVYTIDEIKGITAWAHQQGLIVHMDGARLANAAVHLNCELADITVRAGIDILSFGGTKNGLLCGEAIVVFRRELSASLPFYRKQGMQLASKMRYLACQFLPYLEDELWRRNARRANARALYLREQLVALGAEVPYPTDANEVFAILPPAQRQLAQEWGKAALWDAESGLLRFVASFDTEEEDIDILIDRLRS